VRLEGKKALVTGASRGIGAAIAQRLAVEGADVAITYLKSAEAAADVARTIQNAGRCAHLIKADAADGEAMRACVHQAHAALGGLNILINNAGIFDGTALGEATDERFERIVAINLRAPFIAAREAATLMSSGDRIINMASSFGLRVPAPGIGLYAMTKFGLIGLTRGMARDLGKRGINVNAIAAGPIDTGMNPAEGRTARLMSMMTAFGTYGTPEDVAALAVFLASDDAAYITGTVLSVDGGFNA
jgi:3-oxoacyl-[acyl-carrier protein] reductase